MRIGIGISPCISQVGGASAPPAVTGFTGRIYRAYNEADFAWYWAAEAQWDAIPDGSAEDTVVIESYDPNSLWWTEVATQRGDQTSQGWNAGIYSYDPGPYRIKIVRGGVPGPWTEVPGATGLEAITTFEVSFFSGEATTAIPVPDGSSISLYTVSADSNSTDPPYSNANPADLSTEITVTNLAVDTVVSVFATDSLERDSFVVERTVLGAVQFPYATINENVDSTIFDGQPVTGAVLYTVLNAADDTGIATSNEVYNLVSGTYGGYEVYFVAENSEGTRGLRSATVFVGYWELSIGTLITDDLSGGVWTGACDVATGGDGNYSYELYQNGNLIQSGIDPENITASATVGDNFFVRVTSGDGQTLDTNTVYL